MSWLAKIEALKPGDPCEFHFPARSTWRKATVIKNGGSGYWQVELTESFVDEVNNEPVLEGDLVLSIYIEHVRLPGQEEAWTW